MGNARQDTARASPKKERKKERESDRKKLDDNESDKFKDVRYEGCLVRCNMNSLEVSPKR